MWQWESFSHFNSFSYSSLGGDSKINILDIFLILWIFSSVLHPSASPHLPTAEITNCWSKFRYTTAHSFDWTMPPPTQRGGEEGYALLHASSEPVGYAVSSSGITMVSLFSSMVMCVALGIPSPSKNPSLVNSSWAAGEQLGSLSAFASGTKKENNEDAPLGNFRFASGVLQLFVDAFVYSYKMHKVWQCCLSSSNTF